MHGSSIVSAIGETGLQVYKFGRVTSLARPVPASCLETIETNKKSGMHTLVLLDIGLSAKQGLELLRSDMNEEVVVACRLGGDRVIRYGTIDDLLKQELDCEPAVIIIPSKLHFMEKEFLEALK